MNIRWLGHAAFELESDGTTVQIDPFLTGNPTAAADAGEVSADAILLTHGHGDHYGDVVAIGGRRLFQARPAERNPRGDAMSRVGTWWMALL